MFQKGSWGRKLLIGGGVAGVALLGGGYATYQRRLRENRSISAVDFNAQQDAKAVQWALSHLNDKTLRTKLYRYTTCPFCGTVKVFLDNAKIPYEAVEVEPMLKGEIAESAYKKVPQLRFDTADAKGPYLVDSDIIVNTLAEHTGHKKDLSNPDVLKWREWARGPMVRLITLDFNSSLLAAWRGYSYIDKCDTIAYSNKLFLKVVGAPVMWLVARNFTQPRLIREGILKPGDDPKKRLHEEWNRFVDEALVDPKSKKPIKFHGGAKPDLADLDAFGVLQSVRGHRVYAEIVSGTKAAQWIHDMESELGYGPAN